MSGDYETLEINQPKITYLQKRSENNTVWLDELINQIEDMKNNNPNLLNDRKRVEGIREICKRKCLSNQKELLCNKNHFFLFLI